jgi:putative DNA primase/helicase
MGAIKELNGIVTTPFATPQGIVTTPGYHAPTGAYLHLPNGVPSVPERPNRDEVLVALRTLWGPWSSYRFASPDDRAAMLATIIGALCRMGLPTAPGSFFDAPVQGSGKTKAAEAVAVLVRGVRGVTPYAEGLGQDVEMVKRLVALLLAGGNVFLLDNVTGLFDSSVLAACITSGRVEERILGANQWFRGEGRITVLATGNNAALSRDLGRRFLRVRIDTGIECPQAAVFLFDPVAKALVERLTIAHAVMTAMQAFFQAGKPNLGRGDCGFAEWAGLVRSTVLWLEREGFAEEAGIGALGDPARSILEGASESDPDTAGLRLLLEGLRQRFGEEPFRARDVLALWTPGGLGGGAGALVREGLELLIHRRQNVTARTIGDVLRYRRDRFAGGMVLRACGQDRDGVALWTAQNG